LPSGISSCADGIDTFASKRNPIIVAQLIVVFIKIIGDDTSQALDVMGKQLGCTLF
jgi:hypothetical protein